MARSELTATREDRKYSSAILVRLSGLPTVRRSIIGAVCDNFGGNKHIFWLGAVHILRQHFLGSLDTLGGVVSNGQHLP